MKGAYLRGVIVGSRVQCVSNLTMQMLCLIVTMVRFEDMNRLITANQIKPVIDKVFSFDEVPAAYAYLASQKHVGKVIIKIN